MGKKTNKRAQHHELDILSENDFKRYVPFWDVLDLDRNPWSGLLAILGIRIVWQMVLAHMMYHADENW